MAVLWHHGPFLSSLEAPAMILRRGFTGVDFFFVLSGFLITTLLLREQRSNGRFSLKRFYWRRLLRIVPVYLLVVTAVVAYYVIAQGKTEYLRLIPFYYLFLSNFLVSDVPLLGHTWSLAVEEQYYLLWPLLLALLSRRWILPVLIALIALNIAAVTGALRPFGIVPVTAGPLVFKMFAATYAPILIGSAVALAMDTSRGFALVARVLGHPAAPVAAFAALLVLWQLLPGKLVGWPNLVMHLTMAACLVSIVLREDNVLRPILAFRPVARVGEISYGIYLYHLIGLHIANVALDRAGVDSTLAVLFFYTLISILISEVSFRTFERFFLRMKDGPSGRVRAVSPMALGR
jgi:peptidoglycan/LPS O-acetylase OafA/YrhL